MRGYPIVLTADRVLMAGYRLLFDGMLAASLTTTTPPALVAPLILPPAPVRDGRAGAAPLGLRRIEAALLAGGFTPDEVIVVPEELLPQVVGPDTQLIGISTGEPAGHGMNSTTMAGIAGGISYPEAMVRRLFRTVARLRRGAPHARVVLGGPGAWQAAQDGDLRAHFGIDHVVTGYAEGNVAALFRQILDGEALPEVLAGAGVPGAEVPAICGASSMGVVELSRGCGWGCAFCTLARTPMQHLPEETILADVETNVRAGQTSIAVLSEDLFRYGATGQEVQPARLIGLLERLRGVPGLRLMQCDHVNALSASRYSDGELRAVRGLLAGDTGCEFLWVNVGVETASGALLRAHGGGPKMAGIADEDWADFCEAQMRRLIDAGFLPMVSLLLGLPGETPADVEATLRWVERFHGARITIFPVFYAPIDGTPPLGPRDLTKLHWRLIKTAYANNFRWIPPMYWDQQAAIGLPLGRRLLFQGLGHGQVVLWNALFAWHAARAGE